MDETVNETGVCSALAEHVYAREKENTQANIQVTAGVLMQ